MEILTRIPFSLDMASLLKQAHVESGSSEAERLRVLAAVAMQVGKPKG